MDDREAAGYRELEHTADWALEVWAPQIDALFEQAAQGMFSLLGAGFAPEPPTRRVIHLEAVDRESLLVAFLNELLYLLEHEGWGAQETHVQLLGNGLVAELWGRPVQGAAKEIKAVTYNNLTIEAQAGRLVTRLVFDV